MTKKINFDTIFYKTLFRFMCKNMIKQAKCLKNKEILKNM